MEKKNTFMQTKPIFSLLVSMSVPMMLSMLIQSLYNIVDSIYVSRLGTDALTAVSLAYPLQNTIVSVAVGIGVGISSAISIYLGSGNQENANRGRYHRCSFDGRSLHPVCIGWHFYHTTLSNAFHRRSGDPSGCL